MVKLDKGEFILKILFYSGYMLEPFNGSNYKNAKGARGSEIGMINLAENLVGLGHDVTISFSPILEGTYKGVTYISVDRLQKFIDTNNLDAIVVNRYVHFFVEFIAKAKKVFVWVQDMTLAPNYYDFLLPNYALPVLANSWDKIDGLVLLSDWHVDYFRNFYGIRGEEGKFFKIGNGINPDAFNNVSLNSKKRHKFIFNSNKPTKIDLEDSIKFFLTYKKTYPEAELHVFRGDVDRIFYDGVFYRGVVSNDEMIRELASSQFWIYPEVYLETFCTSALEARAAGCLPIVRVNGGLSESIGELWFSIDDYDIIRKIERVTPEEIESTRKKSLKISWNHRAKQWESLILKGTLV
jgi:glycosyltransferase involved in cell wall biosynthesis